MMLPCHTLQLHWRRRKTSVGFRSLAFRGPDRDIRSILKQQKIDSFGVVCISVCNPNKVALEQYRWEASLIVDHDHAVIMHNGGVWYVGVEPGSEARRGVVEFADPRGGLRTETADVVVSRGPAFRALDEWLNGWWREFPSGDLEWALYRHRGHA